MVLLPLTPVIKDTLSLEMKTGHVTTVNGWVQCRHVKVWFIAALHLELLFSHWPSKSIIIKYFRAGYSRLYRPYFEAICGTLLHI